jgi:hypothetical protein
MATKTERPSADKDGRPLFYCSGPLCPGYFQPASERPHPPSCAAVYIATQDEHGAPVLEEHRIIDGEERPRRRMRDVLGSVLYDVEDVPKAEVVRVLAAAAMLLEVDEALIVKLVKVSV